MSRWYNSSATGSTLSNPHPPSAYSHSNNPPQSSQYSNSQYTPRTPYSASRYASSQAPSTAPYSQPQQQQRPFYSNWSQSGSQSSQASHSQYPQYPQSQQTPSQSQYGHPRPSQSGDNPLVQIRLTGDRAFTEAFSQTDGGTQSDFISQLQSKIREFTESNMHSSVTVDNVDKTHGSGWGVSHNQQSGYYNSGVPSAPSGYGPYGPNAHSQGDSSYRPGSYRPDSYRPSPWQPPSGPSFTPWSPYDQNQYSQAQASSSWYSGHRHPSAYSGHPWVHSGRPSAYSGRHSSAYSSDPPSPHGHGYSHPRPSHPSGYSHSRYTPAPYSGYSRHTPSQSRYTPRQSVRTPSYSGHPYSAYSGHRSYSHRYSRPYSRSRPSAYPPRTYSRRHTYSRGPSTRGDLKSYRTPSSSATPPPPPYTDSSASSVQRPISEYDESIQIRRATAASLYGDRQSYVDGKTSAIPTEEARAYMSNFKGATDTAYIARRQSYISELDRLRSYSISAARTGDVDTVDEISMSITDLERGLRGLERDHYGVEDMSYHYGSSINPTAETVDELDRQEYEYGSQHAYMLSQGRTGEADEISKRWFDVYQERRQVEDVLESTARTGER